MTTSSRPYDLIIFDLDGVITTERIYWECARLTLWELLHLRLQAAEQYIAVVHNAAAREQILPDAVVFEVKNRAVNSNWDLTFLAACAMLSSLSELPAGVGGIESVEDLLDALHVASLEPLPWPESLWDFLKTSGKRRGQELLSYAGRRAAEEVGMPPVLFEPLGEWWQYLYWRFQGWYSGLLMGVWGAAPLPETPVLPVSDLREVLQGLCDTGYTLGIATGRPRDEMLYPLRSFELLAYFDPQRIVTYTEVGAVQTAYGGAFGKPHPYAIRRALHPQARDTDLLTGSDHLPPVAALVIGDSPSDALAARSAGAACLGVLSGVIGEGARRERRHALLNAGCVDVVDDVTAVLPWLHER